ncbi:protein-S-isoprenylcysteine O-methyltransferase [Fistulifera solaris]|uniref:Protein-S-isoprenylcysteine O-methyltransferase n=1 Tax=Fistulifera solaris TaxID=1519565 RepID=A0A1Z5KMF3_FISSO|nr:protein-S-isoprenylcysteine O-methyltransferase [Fistulifera solaris]|eukprot:GAX27469.1 protein-S-isoprenylcysteine O-methyltransferase [Fistulifera solaris]
MNSYPFRNVIQPLQRRLDFQNWQDYPQFASVQSLGRVALIATILGILWGIHAVMCVQRIWGYVMYGSSSLMLWQWSSYMLCLTTFHLLEFFVTALYNHPSALSADSFLVNHSAAYTAAALTSWTEFALHPILPWSNRFSVSCVGLLVLGIGQILRSLAMKTAASSFHHMIQIQPHHTLVTTGIYKYFRHGSYAGFYYWCCGTQLLLGNYLHTIAFAIVCWSFFSKRIPYEEELLCREYPHEYPNYCAKTWIGIPFIRSFGLEEYHRKERESSPGKGNPAASSKANVTPKSN